jgi:hypothetical protein
LDDARVPASGQDDQPAPGEAGDQRLVIEDQRAGFPAGAAPGLVDCEPSLDAGDAAGLAGDQHRPAEQERIRCSLQ